MTAPWSTIPTFRSSKRMARYLVDHPARSIRIEGNCDERGGREYNLALGQRRADAMRERLRLLGGFV